MKSEKEIKKLMKDDPFAYLNEVVKHHEQQWKKSLNKEKNPMIKQSMQDHHRVGRLFADIEYFRIMYGMDITVTVKPVEYPKYEVGEIMPVTPGGSGDEEKT